MTTSADVKAALGTLRAHLLDLPDGDAEAIRELLEEYRLDCACGRRIDWTSYAMCIRELLEEAGLPELPPPDDGEEVTP